jgi:hypothetical protein
MTRANIRLLDNRDPFPQMRFSDVAGGAIVLPEAFGERWNVFLLYRGNF